jgi:transketolase
MNATGPKAEKTQALPELARQMRIDIIRMIEAAGNGHPGGSLSVIDLLTVLYSKFLRHDPKRPDWPDRDRLILSKGHACPALYTAMAYNGYFPREQLLTLRKMGSPLQGHPDRLRLPGVEFSTGSLGQGLSVALGMALAAKLDKKDYKTYCILGDGEMQEGQVWEALMAAPKFGLDNLIAVIDHNNGQIDGPVDKIMDIEPLSDKIAAFKWDVQAIDGHDFGQIEQAFKKAAAGAARPQMIIARTVKGKGVSFMEDDNNWHYKTPDDGELLRALRELGEP